MSASLIRGRVVHVRLAPFRHRFSYRSWMLLADVDALPTLAARSLLFGTGRMAMVSFQERDHGARDGSGLRPWVEQRLAEAGIQEAGARLELLCMPRILGFVFNPISLVFCRDRGDRLAAVLAVVNNTWGGRHTYLLPAGAMRPVIARADKRLAVSPFTTMDGGYDFAISEPGERFAFSIGLSRGGQRILHTAFSGRSVPFSDRALLGCLAGVPLVTMRTFAAIHWQALRLAFRGARFVPPAPNPPEEMSVGR